MSEKTAVGTGETGDDIPPGTGVFRLTPANITLSEGAFGALHCVVAGDQTVYRGVWAVLMFPITHPDAYISLRYTGADDKEKEIGVVVDPSAFPAEAVQLIRRAVLKQYYQRTILRIFGIECQYGVLFFDAETDFGRSEFVVPWRYDRAEDFAVRGKVLLDSFDNRYVIPDVEALPPADRRLFLSFIYW